MPSRAPAVVPARAPAAVPPRASFPRVFHGSVGTKILIGSTGLALVLYLVIHVAGNLMVFFGPEVFNQYAYTLEGNPLIPVVEIGLLIVFLVHVFKTITMFLTNQQARPVRYVQKKYAGRPSRKTFASSTMIFSGLWLLVFIVVHVRAFRYGAEYEWPGGGRDLYRLEMENFSHPWTVAFYVLSMLVVGSHLWHGASSAFQSLGVEGTRWTPRLLAGGRLVAVLIASAFIAIAVWAFLAQRAGT
jgi:succinate dehydrogenase / fumarate reductase cytochrome b subunit